MFVLQSSRFTLNQPELIWILKWSSPMTTQVAESCKLFMKEMEKLIWYSDLFSSVYGATYLLDGWNMCVMFLDCGSPLQTCFYGK